MDDSNRVSFNNIVVSYIVLFRMPRICFTEKVITRVSAFRLLYDPNHPYYTNVNRRNASWTQIAQLIGEVDKDTVENKWEEIKEEYAKYLAAQVLKPNYSKRLYEYRDWTWDCQMYYMRPFLNNLPRVELEFEQPIQPSSPGVIQVVDLQIPEYDAIPIIRPRVERPNPPERPVEPDPQNNEQAQKQDQAQEEEEEKGAQAAAVSPSPPQSEPSRAADTTNDTTSDMTPEYDDIDLLFLSYAKTVKRLKRRRQSTLKYKMAKVMRDAEIAEIANSDLDEDNTNYKCEYHRHLRH